MNTGIHYDIDFDDYLRIDALSNTRMGALQKSPAHYKAAKPLAASRGLVVGGLAHTSCLEPSSLALRYAVCPDYHLDEANQTASGKHTTNKNTTFVKEKTAAFCHANSDKEIVSRDWYTEMQAIMVKLFDDKEARRMFNSKGRVEVTLVWDDPETGIRCKARMDKLSEQLGRFIDLKTTADIIKFPKSFFNYGYHRQFAHYQSGYAVLTGELLTPWVVAVESVAPYCVQTAPVGEETLEEGERQRRKLLTLLHECQTKDDWPGPPAPKSWQIPEWALNMEPVELLVGGQKVSI